MRLLLHEHLTAAWPADVRPHLLMQGEAMIRALAADLADCPGVEVSVTPTARHADAAMEIFDRAVAGVDAVWPIAPETGGCLEALSRRVLAAGRRLCNSQPDAVRVTASKWRTAQVLRAAGIPTVPVCRHLHEVPPHWEAVVMKPDDGAGCEDTFVLRGPRAEWRAPGAVPADSASTARRGDHPANVVLQPFVPGPARSLAVLCGAHGAQVLSVNAQHVLEMSGRLHFDGVDPAVAPVDAGLCALADAVLRALPGLRGFVGIDYIATSQGPVVVEINPRLTTAYVGLSARLGCNVARRVLDVFDLMAADGRGRHATAAEVGTVASHTSPGATVSAAGRMPGAAR